jgi:hypothetical protein
VPSVFKRAIRDRTCPPTLLKFRRLEFYHPPVSPELNEFIDICVNKRRIERAVGIDSGETIARLTADAHETSADYNLSVQLYLNSENRAVGIRIKRIRQLSARIHTCRYE